MTSGAHVGSIDAIRDFLAAFQTFAHETHDALDSFSMEIQRSLESLVNDEPALWKRELRKRDEAVNQARIELERARLMTLPGGEKKSCMEERKQLDRARQRRLVAEEKIETARRWAATALRANDEYAARATQLNATLASEFERAVAMLNRVLDALEAYTADTAVAAPPRADESTPRGEPPDEDRQE